MQETVPYNSNHTPKPPPLDGIIINNDVIAKTVSENAVVVLGRRGCCMCHVIRTLLQGLGVNPPVFEVEQAEGISLSELTRINDDGGKEVIELPAVFVGGKLFGGLEKLMATHISGELVPVLKEARALWL